MSRLALISLLAVLHLPFPTFASAQNGLEDGAWVLELALPDSRSPAVGAWRMVSDRTRLGLQLRGEIVSTDYGATDQTQYRIGLTPALRRYLREAGRVVPYFQPQLDLGFTFRGSNDRNTSEIHGAISGALGLEWFPVREISLSGQTGVRIFASRYEVGSTAPYPVGNEPASWGISTFTTSISLNIFLPPPGDRERGNRDRRRR